MLSYTNCELCPRPCHADRTRGELGFCREPDHIYAARAAAHYWEEPVISGSFGSGAVFFSGCTLKCMTYYENRNIKAFARAQKQVSRFAHLNYAAGR